MNLMERLALMEARLDALEAEGEETSEEETTPTIEERVSALEETTADHETRIAAVEADEETPAEEPAEEGAASEEEAPEEEEEPTATAEEARIQAAISAGTRQALATLGHTGDLPGAPAAKGAAPSNDVAALTEEMDAIADPKQRLAFFRKHEAVLNPRYRKP